MSHWAPVDQMQDLVNKIGGEERIKRFQSGELVLVERMERSAPVVVASDNGGISPYVVPTLLNIELFIADWKEFYRQVHSMDMNPKFDRLPPPVPGFNWGVWVPEGMTPQLAFAMGEAMYPSWKWCGGRPLDDVMDFTKEVRIAKRQYAVWCRDRVEADEELKNISAVEIASRQINTLTLIEVLLLHQWFFWKSGGKHLDTRYITRCDGSRYSDGRVPRVDWLGFVGNELRISWYDSNNADSHRCRPRQAMS